MDDKILIVDAVYQSIEIFAPTTYGGLIIVSHRRSDKLSRGQNIFSGGIQLSHRVLLRGIRHAGDKGEIIEFDQNGQYVRALGDPHCIGLNTSYKPKKLVVDSVGRIYVLIQNCYEGFAELDPEGNFNRYVGATEVTYSLSGRTQ